MWNGVQVLFWGILAVLAPSLIARGQSVGTSPAAVVRQYCELDMKGARLSSQNPYMDRISALGTWSIEPGWDSVIVVRNFVIVRVHSDHGTSSVEVRYTVLGQMTGASVTASRQHDELITFVMGKSENAWKIERPLIPPHVSVQAAAANLRDLISDENNPKNKERLDQGLAVLSRWVGGPGRK
jgi:hypothetical protein